MVDAYSGFVRNVKRADEAIRLENTKNIKLMVNLKNMKYENKSECVFCSKVLKFRIARTTKPAFDRFLQVRLNKRMYIFLLFLTNSIDDTFNWFDDFAGDATGAEVSKLFFFAVKRDNVQHSFLLLLLIPFWPWICFSSSPLSVYGHIESWLTLISLISI